MQRDLARDLRYAQAAEAVYRAIADAREIFAALGYDAVLDAVDPETGTEVFVAAGDVEVLIVARGTERDYRDILTDLKIRRRELAGRIYGAAVHRGFLAAWWGVEEQVRDALEELGPIGDRRVVACGHSLGGAVAILAGALLHGLVDEIVSFGAPRVGDGEFRELMENLDVPHRRYVNAADVVPAVPLLAMGYRHDVPSHYIGCRGRLHPEASLLRELLGRAQAFLTLRWAEGWSVAPVPLRMFTDHRIAAYVDALHTLDREARA